MQETMYPFLIARTSNESILREIGQKLKFIDIRKIILNEPTALMNYVGQMRNFSANTHMVIDVSAISENDEEFVEALEGIQLQRDDMKIIIYAVDLKNGKEFLNTLVRNGYTNIVAVSDEAVEETAKWEQIKSDLQECFSEEGLSEKRWKTYRIDVEPPLESVQMQLKEENEQEIKVPDFSDTHVKICVFGTDRRVGTTTAALTIASYFSAGKADVKVVLQSAQHIAALKSFYGFDSADTEVFNYSDNIVFSSSAEQDESDIFNAVVIDMGKYGRVPLQPNAVNIIVADVSFDGISNSVGQLDSAYLMEDEPFKVIINLCGEEELNKILKNGLIDQNSFDYISNPPLLMPYIKDKMAFDKTEGNIKVFNSFFACNDDQT